MKWSLWSLIPDLSFLRKKKKKKKRKLQSLGDIESCACSSSSSSQEEEALLEMAREALASRRLSFEEDESCSLLSMVGFPFMDCLVLVVESENPKIDFLHSMEQMTKAYNCRFMKPGTEEMDWEFLEDLLTWFLRINNMKNQDVIVAAFVDLCLLLSSSS